MNLTKYFAFLGGLTISTLGFYHYTIFGFEFKNIVIIITGITILYYLTFYEESHQRCNCKTRVVIRRPTSSRRIKR